MFDSTTSRSASCTFDVEFLLDEAMIALSDAKLFALAETVPQIWQTIVDWYERRVGQP